jgi:hypothetical protein
MTGFSQRYLRGISRGQLSAKDQTGLQCDKLWFWCLLKAFIIKKVDIPNITVQIHLLLKKLLIIG